MKKEAEKQDSEKREGPIEFCMLKFTDTVSTDFRRYVVNPRVVLSEPEEFLKLKQKQNKITADRHPLGTEYDEKFLAKARANNGSFGLIDAIEVLTEDGWEPTQTLRLNRYDNMVLFKRAK